MGDEALIDDLELYLNLKDSIEIIRNGKTEYKNIIQKLKDLNDHNDEEKIQEIIQDYLRR